MNFDSPQHIHTQLKEEYSLYVFRLKLIYIYKDIESLTVRIAPPKFILRTRLKMSRQHGPFPQFEGGWPLSSRQCGAPIAIFTLHRIAAWSPVACLTPRRCPVSRHKFQLQTGIQLSDLHLHTAASDLQATALGLSKKLPANKQKQQQQQLPGQSVRLQKSGDSRSRFPCSRGVRTQVHLYPRTPSTCPDHDILIIICKLN